MNVKEPFASLVVLPTVIVLPGRYLTRSGEVVVIERVDMLGAAKFGCHGRYADGTVEHWHESGRLLFGRTTDNDIVSKYTQEEGA